MTVGLVLGDLDLIDPNGSPFGVKTLAEDTRWGNPQPIEVAVRSLLQDGSIVVHQGDDNREVTLRVIVSAADSAALAEGEAALMAELYRPNTLTYTPADGWGPPTVFTVITSSLAHVMDDLAEVRLNERHYSVRLVCEPFGRSEDEVVTEALPASGTTTTNVTDGSTTTNWTGAVNGASTAPSVVSGAVRVTNGAAVYGGVLVSATYAASIDTSATKYLIVDWKSESPTEVVKLRAYGDGVELTRLAEAASPTAGFTRTWFGPVSASALAALTLSLETFVWDGGGAPARTRSLYVDNVSRSDAAPSLGTGRQLLRTIEVPGSARGQGAVAIEHASSALGDTLAYFYPATDRASGYSPPLRQYRSSLAWTPTTDAAMVSGAREDIKANYVQFSIPLSRLLPGLHLLMVRLATTGGAGQFVWTTGTTIGGTAVGDNESGVFSFPSAASQTLFAVTRLNLPTVDVDPASTTAAQSIRLDASGSAALTVVFDEAWLFNLSVGRLVGPVTCGTGAPAPGGDANRLFLEPATVVTPRPTIRVGTAADRSDSFHAIDKQGWQFPEFTPPAVNVFTVTTNALDASVKLRQFPRWHTHAPL